jgi:hypothetical protein
MPRNQVYRRVVRHFLVDLTVSVGIVLAVGSLLQNSAGDAYLQGALVTQSDVYVAISRFSPPRLLFSYLASINDLTQGGMLFDGTDGLAQAPGQALWAVGRTTLGIGLAAPYTLAALYRQTSGIASMVVLAGFALSGAAILGWLLMTRIAPGRLLLASLLSPIAVSLVFAILQAFMLLMLDAFFWLTALSPYAVICPVVCTLYWVAFPRAKGGATATVAHTIGRVFSRRQR